jgi:hypothetical protein
MRGISRNGSALVGRSGTPPVKTDDRTLTATFPRLAQVPRENSQPGAAKRETHEDEGTYLPVGIEVRRGHSFSAPCSVFFSLFATYSSSQAATRDVNGLSRVRNRVQGETREPL